MFFGFFVRTYRFFNNFKIYIYVLHLLFDTPLDCPFHQIRLDFALNSYTLCFNM